MAYPRNFLSKVVFQINFLPIEAIKRGLDQRVIQTCVEITGAPLVLQKNTNINVNSSDSSVSTQQTPKWTFVGEEIEMFFLHDSFNIISKKYTTYTDFHPHIERTFNLFRDIYNPSFARTALRYINNISFPNGDAFDFNGLINEPLLRPTKEFSDQFLMRSMGSMILQDSERSITTNFNYGFFNSQFPNIIALREFILDYDCYYIHRDGDNIKTILMNLRNRINTLFEKSISEGLRNILNEQR